MTVDNLPLRRAAMATARNTRRYGADSEEAHESRRVLAEEQIAAAIRRSLADAPPLRNEQIDRLLGLLTPAPAEEHI